MIQLRKRKIVWVFAILCLIAFAGTTYQRIRASEDAKRFPQVGQRVDVGGRTLNLNCSGKGEPTVIFESTHGVPGLAWNGVQSQISSLVRTCWYDRAGYGWSDEGPSPRHSNEIARDLHVLLKNAGISPPYILVGHGFGAFNVRAFRGLYPEEVKGMVLADAPSDDADPRNPTVPPKKHIEALRPAVIVMFRIVGELGLLRLLQSPSEAPPGFSPVEWQTIQALMIQPKSVEARVQETPLFESAIQVRAAGSLGDMPLIVVSPEPQQGDARGRLKLAYQSALVKLSTDGKQVIVPHVRGVWWPYSAPEMVESIIRVLKECQRNRSGEAAATSS